MNYLDSAIQSLIDEGYSITLSPSPNKADYIEIRLARGKRYLKIASPKKVIFNPEASYLGVELMLIKQDLEELETE